MNSLPASIEAYLLEAGFSSTELFILKHLLSEDAMTLRQLAIKTGKSTGVLDQAMRKLIQKNLIAHEVINDQTKLSLLSLEAVSDWVHQDMKRRHEEMQQRHQNFETFLSTIERDKKRPVIQYYDGEVGIKQAYMRLLTCGKEQLQYVPINYKEEEDPLRDFRVEYFRARRSRGIFARVIANNTPLGRRYQSRDPFEYRQTLLVEEEQFSLSFEKIICGDTVTCFNHAEKKASFIQYPELAETEKSVFEGLWKKETVLSKTEKIVYDPTTIASVSDIVIPLKTKILSRLREFFLSRESLVTLGLCALIAATSTYGLYRYTSNLNFRRMQEKVISIAATGTSQFRGEELNALRKEEDWQKPEWKTVVDKLREIRENNDDVLFAYIIRKRSNDTMEFVADSHSINPYANIDDDASNDVDANGDGKLEPQTADFLQWPGQIYPTPPLAAFEAYKKITSSNFYEDQWGKVITGYAPIFDSQKNPIAILAIDLKFQELERLNAQTFSPLLYFIGIFVLFILIRLTAFNRSLLAEILEFFK